ncbi:MAG: ATP-binding protein [Candidatus Binatia bacterium]
MLLEPTLDKLTALQLHGMVAALRQWQAQPPRELLAPLDLVGLLADAEWLTRENRKLTTRLKTAKLKLTACVEDLDYRHPRGLPKALVQELSASRWVAAHQTVVITGPTGVGKSYVACALAHKACRDGFTVAYRRVSRLYDELAQARADGTYLTALRRLAKVQLLVLDSCGAPRNVASPPGGPRFCGLEGRELHITGSVYRAFSQSMIVASLRQAELTSPRPSGWAFAIAARFISRSTAA